MPVKKDDPIDTTNSDTIYALYAIEGWPKNYGWDFYKE